MIWPWLEPWIEHFSHSAQGMDWNEGSIDQQDNTGSNFINLLVYLRVVLLQDLAILQPGNSPFHKVGMYIVYIKTGKSGIPLLPVSLYLYSLLYILRSGIDAHYLSRVPQP
jgi:hypothetical protein